MGPSPLEHNWEGFAVHMADVTGNTTGGIPVSKLESYFHTRLGDLDNFDTFMDYSVTFFTYDLQPFHDAFKKDAVPFLMAEWQEISSQRPWYSLIFQIPHSTYIIELVSPHKPVGCGRVLPKLEQRITPAAAAMFRGYAAPLTPILWVASINRASSNMSQIDEVYQNIFHATVTHEVVTEKTTRRCYKMSSERAATSYNTYLWNQVCFTSRSADAEKDAVFSVVDFERMLWRAHAQILAGGPASQMDKFTDNHNGLLMSQQGLQALKDRFVAHNPYPITKVTRLAYLCKQSYIIDPTGWSILPVLGPTWPGCGR